MEVFVTAWTAISGRGWREGFSWKRPPSAAMPVHHLCSRCSQPGLHTRRDRELTPRGARLLSADAPLQEEASWPRTPPSPSPEQGGFSFWASSYFFAQPPCAEASDQPGRDQAKHWPPVHPSQGTVRGPAPLLASWWIETRSLCGSLPGRVWAGFPAPPRAALGTFYLVLSSQ